jgi:hypothetical protein
MDILSKINKDHHDNCINFFNLPVSKSASFIASLLLDIEYAVEKANST